MKKKADKCKVLIVRKRNNGWALLNDTDDLVYQSILKGATLFKATQMALIEKKCKLVIYCKNDNIQEIRNYSMKSLNS